MTKRAHNGAIQSLLEKKLTVELQKSFMWSWKMSSQQNYLKLTAKLEKCLQRS